MNLYKDQQQQKEDIMELYLGYFENNMHHVGSCANSRSHISPFRASSRMGMCEENHHIGMWEDSFKADSSQNTCASTVMESDMRIDYLLEDIPLKALGKPKKYDHKENKTSDKVLRRLAQNRVAARKSRLRKKAYVQELESSRLKLAQLEQEVEKGRHLGMYTIGGNMRGSPLGVPGSVNIGIAAFEMEYGHWVEEQNRQTCELRAALQANMSDLELHMLVESGMRHYDNLFQIKSKAANSDVFYLMSGMWRTSTERFFLWIGGFRPSELLKALYPQLDPLSEQQMTAVCSLRLSSQQAEDALSQGLEKLQQTLSETLTCNSLGTSCVSGYMGQMANAMGKLDALVSFLNQADHLRQQTLQQMHSILTTRQAARGLLALGDYFQRLRALSSLWAARPCKPASKKSDQIRSHW
ncbi:transcription factor TGA4-like isoform X1 [Zingiber officinale]|uniref:transcription factor TGA4-like isoform X1 n=1 Tax=Zingiber officinale TaxID=94328 RepID=UPI001C4C1CC6|nr:transcription factor TGA4-like isoform X1 [Zingiber officinale]